MDKIICKGCGKEFDRDEMRYTRDCHGIAYRLVCEKCYDMLMARGYDGEYYTELDENIDPD